MLSSSMALVHLFTIFSRAVSQEKNRESQIELNGSNKISLRNHKRLCEHVFKHILNLSEYNVLLVQTS